MWACFWNFWIRHTWCINTDSRENETNTRKPRDKIAEKRKDFYIINELSVVYKALVLRCPLPLRLRNGSGVLIFPILPYKNAFYWYKLLFSPFEFHENPTVKNHRTQKSSTPLRAVLYAPSYNTLRRQKKNALIFAF